MSLLTGLMTDSLDASYAEVAAARAARGVAPRRRPGAALVVGVVALGLLLGTSAATTRERLPAAERERVQLAQRVQERSAAVAALVVRAAQLQEQVAATRQQALAVSAEGRRLSPRLTRLEIATGAVGVVGPGVRLRVQDAAGTSTTGGPLDVPRAGGPVSEGRVTDRDLQQLVNGLWAAGAEAVAVNGVRLSARTAIRAAGDAILVDFRPVLSPYVIEAVGDPRTLPTRFAATAGGTYLAALQANWGIRGSIVGVDELTLPAASSLDVLVAKPAAGS